jgi:hypothetical protein
LSQRRKSQKSFWPKAGTDRDAELDAALRELGEEVLRQEIPERLLRVLRPAKEAGSKPEQDDQEPR